MTVKDVAVSVIVPVYNRATLVADAIHSALHASVDFEVEVIVVDASTDDTWAKLAAHDDPRVRWFVSMRTAGHPPRATVDWTLREAHL